MKKEYDIVYLTNTPSFYKLNLCNELGKEGLKILLVFYGYGSEAVNTVLSDEKAYAFDFHFLHQGDSHKRFKAKVFFKLLKLMRDIKAKRVLFAGWLAPEYNLYAIFSSKKKNAVIIESGYESTETGIKGLIKRKIMGRMSSALPSGKPHANLINKLGFMGDVFLTGGVGLIDMSHPKPGDTHKSADTVRFLYVGRLIECKNLKFLITAFNELGLPLTIVGKGPQESELKKMASDNIKFTGFIPNDKLVDVYRNHDVFVLPSSSEPWGLVVEEALYNGIPVLVSDCVGSKVDLVENTGAGLVFHHDDLADFKKKIMEISDNYANFAQKAAKLDFNERKRLQLSAYKSLISEKISR